MGFVAIRNTNPFAANHLLQRIGKQAHPIVEKIGRSPGSYISDPGLCHQRTTDPRNDHRRLTRLRQQYKPGPRRTFPEARQKAGEVVDIGMGRYQQSVQPLAGHRRLCPGKPCLELGLWKSALSHRCPR